MFSACFSFPFFQELVLGSSVIGNKSYDKNDSGASHSLPVTSSKATHRSVFKAADTEFDDRDKSENPAGFHRVQPLLDKLIVTVLKGIVDKTCLLL